MQSALPLAGDLPRRRQDIPYLLTLYPEWAWAFNLGKNVENRGWEPPDRLLDRWLAIRAGAHVGGRPGFPAALNGMTNMAKMATRAGWHHNMNITNIQGRRQDVKVSFLHSTTGQTLATSRADLPRRCVTHVARLRNYTMTSGSDWAVDLQVHWEFDRVITLDKPVPNIMGTQGLGIPDPETVRQILKQVRAA